MKAYNNKLICLILKFSVMGILHKMRHLKHFCILEHIQNQNGSN